jgi:hypothetical protein
MGVSFNKIPEALRAIRGFLFSFSAQQAGFEKNKKSPALSDKGYMADYFMIRYGGVFQ